MPNTPHTYEGTIFHYGDEIPGYVSYTYTPKIWYDKSKSVNSDTFNGPYGASWDIQLKHRYMGNTKQ